MAPDIVFSPLPNTRSRHTSDGRGIGGGGVVPGVVRCGRYMKLMSCNNKPKYMTKQRPEEKQQQQQQQKKRNRKNSALHVVRCRKGRERERGREEKRREGGREVGQTAGRVRQPGLK